jgi:hypothetical protein
MFTKKTKNEFNLTRILLQKSPKNLSQNLEGFQFLKNWIKISNKTK